MGDYETVEYESADGVATIWLNRPDKRNALNHAMFDELRQAGLRAETDGDVRIVVLRGRGPAFCAGGDLSMIRHEMSVVPLSLRITQSAAQTFATFYELSKPTVTVVHGHAVAGGFELMISTDFAICTTDAKIGDFHITRALFGGGGPLYRLPRIVGMRRAKEIMMSGRIISGAEAERIGLVNACVDGAEMESAVTEFVKPFVAHSPIAMSITKMAINRGLDADSQTLMTLEHFAASLIHMTDDSREGLDAFLDKREPTWRGA
jgi:enoyl-CoA hydratase